MSTLVLLDNNFMLDIRCYIGFELTNIRQINEQLVVSFGNLFQIVLVLALNVALQGARIAVAFVAAFRLALEWLFLLVGEKVAVQVVLPLEALVALMTKVLTLIAKSINISELL